MVSKAEAERKKKKEAEEKKKKEAEEKKRKEDLRKNAMKKAPVVLVDSDEEQDQDADSQGATQQGTQVTGDAAASPPGTTPGASSSTAPPSAAAAGAPSSSAPPTAATPAPPPAPTGIVLTEAVLKSLLTSVLANTNSNSDQQMEELKTAMTNFGNAITSAVGNSSTNTAQASTSTAQPPKADPMAEPPAEIRVTAQAYEPGTGGVRPFEKCKLWAEMGQHGFTAYNLRKTKEVWTIPELANKDQFYEWNLALEEMLGMCHLKELVQNFLRDPNHYIADARPSAKDPLRFSILRRDGLGTGTPIKLAPIQLAKIHELNYQMTKALKGAAAHLVHERQADNFMDKLFILEHHWGASNPQNKKQFWHEFTTSRYDPLKKTPYEWFHRMSWLLQKCPDLTPNKSARDQFLRNKLIDGMPSTWAHIINTIHEDTNKDPAHIAQRLENFYQNLRSGGKKTEFATAMLTGIRKPDLPTPPPKRPKTNAPTPDFPPQPPPSVIEPTKFLYAGLPFSDQYGRCWLCGSSDHRYQQCPKKEPAAKGKEKGKGKGGKDAKDKGKGKGGKGGKKGKGKGKGKNSEEKKKTSE